MVATMLLLALLMVTVEITGAQPIGVCNGGLGHNLPNAPEVVELYKSQNIGRMRIYSPDQKILQALRGSNIELMLDVPNEQLSNLASNQVVADEWVQTNIRNYPDVKFKYIAVGNEVNPNVAEKAQYAPFVYPAMKNIYNAIVSAGLQGQIKVSTAVNSPVVGTSSPPAAGEFRGDLQSYLKPIIDFLVQNEQPLLANIYPYFAYIGNKEQIPLPFALFTATGPNESGYRNLFDAMVDALYSSLEKYGANSVEIVVSESGWPSEGRPEVNVNDAGTYYSNLIAHVKEGTPKRPGRAIETYLFAMFDENKKEGEETEKHFGLFSPNKQPKYQLSFS